jgi:hypothetical protein
MANDFLDISNIRLLWTPHGSVSTLRDGVPAAGSSVVIEAFLKGDGLSSQALAGKAEGTVKLSGYITRYAQLPSGVDWLAGSGSFSWQIGGLRPAGLLPSAQGPAFLGDLDSLPTIVDGGLQGAFKLMDLGFPYGIGGIGAELRSELGDKLSLVFATVI